MVFLKDVFEKVDFDEIHLTTKKHAKSLNRQRVKVTVNPEIFLRVLFLQTLHIWEVS